MEGKNKEKISHSLQVNFVAGGCARSAAAALLHPLDVVKTRFQYQRSENQTSHLNKYRNTPQALVKILSEEGIGALYRGLLVRLTYIVPSAAINFTIYEQFKYVIRTKEFSWLLPASVLLAGLGRTCMTFFRTPFDIVKQELQVDTTGAVQGSRLARVIELVKSQRGNTGFFKGFMVTVSRDMCFSGTYFTTYELFKYFLSHDAIPDVLKHGSSGAAAGIAGTLVSIPLDVLKTRIQTEVQLPTEKRYTNLLGAIRTIYQIEGPKAFFRGLTPRLLSTIPSASLTFVIYEYLKKVMTASIK